MAYFATWVFGIPAASTQFHDRIDTSWAINLTESARHENFNQELFAHLSSKLRPLAKTTFAAVLLPGIILSMRTSGIESRVEKVIMIEFWHGWGVKNIYSWKL